MLRFFRLGEDHLYHEVENWQDADWLHFEEPTSEEQEFLKKSFEIPQDFILDTMDRYEVPRQETYETKKNKQVHLFLALYPAIQRREKEYLAFETLPFAMIQTEDKLITVSAQRPAFLEAVYTNENDPNHFPLKGSEIILDIFWELTKSYIDGITEVDETIKTMEQNIMNTTKNEWFHRLIAVHKNLVYFKTGVTENHELIQHLIQSDKYSEKPLSQNLLHDIQVISRQAGIMVHEADQMITHLSEVFSSVISNNLNNIMKFLTSLTLVLTIPTIIGSFWGMNVGLPIEKNPFAFVLLILFSILLSLVTIYWLKKKDYL